MTHHPSHGAVLDWDPAGGTSYVAIGQVKDITGPSQTRDTIEVTDHDSGGWKEYIAGLRDGGELTFTIGYDNANAQHAALLTSMGSSVIPAWELTLNVTSGTAVWTFDGQVTGFTANTPVSGENTIDITVKISGSATLTTS